MRSSKRKQSSPTTHTCPRTFQCERLEPRLVLTAGLCITEFMASNSETLEDSFGEYSDWVELYNDSANTIDLSSYHLTDDALQLDKFALPAVDLLPGEAILVFASGRGVVTAEGEIHANFSLSASGDYLGLADANGSLVQDFGDMYPAQLQDVSYGVEMFAGTDPSVIVASESTARMLIPTAANGPGLGLDWVATGYDDAGWTSADLPAGYETGSGYQDLINTTVPSGTISTYLRIPFTMTSLNATSDLTLNVKYDDGFVAYLNGHAIAEDRAPGSPDWNSVATSNHADGLAVQDQPFDVASAASYLQVGQNVLAIHALNVSTGSSDYLIDVNLEGYEAGIATPIQTGFFRTPTPRAANGEVFQGFVDEVAFSLEHGFYNQTQSLTLTTPTSGAKIIYTTDGSDPMVDDNLNPVVGTEYTGPISISQTTVVRAAAFALDQAPSLSRARTYLFTSDIVNQSPNGEVPGPGWPSDADVSAEIVYGMDPYILNTYGQQAVETALQSISSVSIVTDVDNLFDPDIGIYVNARNRGSGWERFSSLELIEPDGSPGFQSNMGLRIRGGYSRNDGFPKRSLRFFFREEYGNAKLEYDFFGGDGATKFDVLDLRTSQNYSWANGNDDRNTFLREVFGRDTQRDMGQTYTRSRYHHLYINGVYWGLYQTQERVEAYFGQEYLGGDKEDYDRVKNNNADGYRTEVADGNDEDWQALFTLAQDLADDPTGNADNYWTMQGLNPDGTRNSALPVLLDVDNLIDYELVLFFTGGFDSGISNFLGNNRGNNWVAIRNRETDDRGFQFFIHDNEHSMGVSGNSNDRTGPWYSDNDSLYIWQNPGFIHQDLLVHEEYRLRFQDRVQQHFFNDGALVRVNNIDRLDERVVDVNSAILGEAARWGDTNRSPSFTPANWLSEVNDLKAWINSRNSTVLAQLQNDGLRSIIAPPLFTQHGGAVPAGTLIGLSTTAANSQIYFTTDQSDPRLPGGGISPTAQLYSSTIPISENTTIQARVRLSSGEWSAISTADFRLPGVPADASNLRVSEIYYHPTDPTALELLAIPSVTANSFEFIEFHNTSDVAIDLTGVQITSPVDFTFPDATLPAGGFLVVPRDQAAFELRTGISLPGIGEYGDASGFGDGGDTVTVLASDGQAIQSFAYDDSGDWPTLADGDGFSLEVVDFNGDYDDPLNWVPSRSFLGSPTIGNAPGASSSGLRITEVNYNPSATGSEFVEIQNTSGATIDLTGVRLVEGVTFDFTDSNIVSLDPGQFVLVVKDQVEFELQYGNGLPVAGTYDPGALSDGGERVILFDGPGDVIHDFVYDDADPWYPSTDGAGYSLEVISTSGDYSDAANWQPSTVIDGTPGSLDATLACDYVGGGNGCDIDDINALYAGTDGAPTPLTDELITQWLTDASSTDNPAKSNVNDMYTMGDVDLDGNVSSADLGILLNNFGLSSSAGEPIPGWGEGNLSVDSTIDSTDLGRLLNSFGFVSPAAASAPVQRSLASNRDADQPAPGSDYAWVPQTESQTVDAELPTLYDLVFGQIDDEDDQHSLW